MGAQAEAGLQLPLASQAWRRWKHRMELGGCVSILGLSEQQAILPSATAALAGTLHKLPYAFLLFLLLTFC